METDTTVALSTCHDGDSGEIAHYCKYILYSENDKNDEKFELVILWQISKSGQSPGQRRKNDVKYICYVNR